METTELLEIIARGEDSAHQFKANITNPTKMATELVAFSNSGGGMIILGAGDDGSFSNLTREDIGRLNQIVSNAASEIVRPPINPKTENVSAAGSLVMVVTVSDGVSKPYMDKNGVIWVKSGSDKRKATSREEIQRLFQSAGLIHGDEIPAKGLSVADLDTDYFKEFLERTNPVSIEKGVTITALLRNMNLMNEGILNIAGALLFATKPNVRLPVFIVKAISYPSNDIHGRDYIDSQDITGKLSDIFHQSISFVLGNIRNIQGDQNVNAPGKPEIPRIVLEELITNALIHRDYFISAPVRIFVFTNRVEIISPGHLPNNLTVENIKSGNSNIRNPILASYATKVLPYRGLGNGIIRALSAYPDIEFYNDLDGNLFKVVIKRAV